MKFLIILLTFFCIELSAQGRRFTVSGNITDSATGEDLIGATVHVEELRTGTTTNVYGFYTLTLPDGQYRLIVSFIGYEQHTQMIDLTQNIRLNIGLETSASTLSEVVVTAERRDVNVSSAEMSVERISMQTLRRIPALMGEVDVIKAIQMLPGVQATSEGTSGFSVRGGSHDQNLIILDEATVYNATHLMGFFSVFNNDALKDVKLYKGDIPANFGGRLSSVLDVRTKDGNNQRFSATGGIGTISSRLTVEGPLFSDRLTYLASGRRTYADVFLALSPEVDMRNTSLYFYDLNAKVNYRINDKNRVFIAAYLGRDKFDMNIAGMDFGNQTATLRWNHLFSPRLFSNFSLIGSVYDYYLRMELSDDLAMDWRSQIQDIGLKADFSFHPDPNHNIKFGYQPTYHRFMPGKGGGIGASMIGEFSQPMQYSLEHAWYLASETKINNKMTVKYGLRYTLFQNIGNGEETYTLVDYELHDPIIRTRGKIYHNTGRWEPRLGAVYQFNSVHSVKASYSRTAQFIQLASNSAAGSPLDVWFQSSPNVAPQLCNQFAVGYFRNFRNNMFETSLEFYYKNMSDVIDFKDHAALFGNDDLERELRFGKGKSYGMELMVRKNEGKLNGWVSYTLSRALRTIDQINDGKEYRSPFDKPHNISIVANYELSPRWIVSANWVYATGMPVTYPTGRYQIEGRYIPLYSVRNEHRYPDYHRLDLSATMTLGSISATRRFKSELNFSLYNAYGRKNPWTIIPDLEKPHPDPTKFNAEMIYLFSFVPSVTYNFTF